MFAATPTTTIFASPFYNRTDGDFSFGSFNSDTGGPVIGGLFKLHDILLVHGAFVGGHPHEGLGPGDLDQVDSIFFEARLGTDLIFLNTEPVKGG